MLVIINLNEGGYDIVMCLWVMCLWVGKVDGYILKIMSGNIELLVEFESKNVIGYF